MNRGVSLGLIGNHQPHIHKQGLINMGSTLCFALFQACFSFIVFFRVKKFMRISP